MLPEATREGNKIHGLLGVLNLTLQKKKKKKTNAQGEVN